MVETAIQAAFTGPVKSESKTPSNEVATVLIDPTGDLILEVRERDGLQASAIRVSSALMAHHSVVLRGVLDPDFKLDASLDPENPMTLTVKGDPCEMRLLCAVFHCQHDEIPVKLDFDMLRALARLAGTWQCRDAFKRFVQLWLLALLEDLMEKGFIEEDGSSFFKSAVNLMSIANAFQLGEPFCLKLLHKCYEHLPFHSHTLGTGSCKLSTWEEKMRSVHLEAKLMILEAINLCVEGLKKRDEFQRCRKKSRCSGQLLPPDPDPLTMLESASLYPASAISNESISSLYSKLPIISMLDSRMFRCECQSCGRFYYWNWDNEPHYDRIKKALVKAQALFKHLEVEWRHHYTSD
ncbi:hypothetical protein BCR37DRAFT_110679 [Protomyces lactucae-debilis]|uniref:BTB domain-containing protein n=1 Tax=Protomyces lactucae-debilis TaxID=2754530 RepID=A0A1Y2F423_PROLT|nr:uncharacterized protein BCR37DRAFT_110679 [Protomyces lactucae-debilis]ORY78650.1 hypothetical protein BCR37DRAFT_110679 [Protomyces lactucae-debilis]